MYGTILSSCLKNLVSAVKEAFVSAFPYRLNCEEESADMRVLKQFVTQHSCQL